MKNETSWKKHKLLVVHHNDNNVVEDDLSSQYARTRTQNKRNGKNTEQNKIERVCLRTTGVRKMASEAALSCVLFPGFAQTGRMSKDRMRLPTGMCERRSGT